MRATWLKVVPDLLDRSLDFYRMAVLQEMEGLDGFCSASLMVDHPASRRAVSCSTFDSMDAMAVNRDRATDCAAGVRANWAPRSSTSPSSSCRSPSYACPSWSEALG